MSNVHTPGPWRVDHNNFDNAYVLGPDQQLPNDHIAHVKSLRGTQSSHDPVREANARLIAAAPAMLDALRAMVDRFSERDCQMLVNGQPPHGEPCATCNAMRAIEQATNGR